MSVLLLYFCLILSNRSLYNEYVMLLSFRFIEIMSSIVNLFKTGQRAWKLHNYKLKKTHNRSHSSDNVNY